MFYLNTVNLAYNEEHLNITATFDSPNVYFACELIWIWQTL